MEAGQNVTERSIFHQAVEVGVHITGRHIFYREIAVGVGLAAWRIFYRFGSAWFNKRSRRDLMFVAKPCPKDQPHPVGMVC